MRSNKVVAAASVYGWPNGKVTARVTLTPLTTLVVRAQAMQDRFTVATIRNTDSYSVMPGFELRSQALISGAFSLTRQAIQLGYAPRLDIEHTSSAEVGQVYVPQVNWALAICTIAIVIGFESSTALAAAYGIAVTMTMVITAMLQLPAPPRSDAADALAIAVTLANMTGGYAVAAGALAIGTIIGAALAQRVAMTSMPELVAVLHSFVGARLDNCQLIPITDLLPYVADKNPAKQGQHLPGSRIPIVDEAHLRAHRPDRVLILPWNLRAEVTQQLEGIRAWGGKFVTAVPALEITP